jgi:hypothetical protein
MSGRPGPFDFAGQKERSFRLWERTGWEEIATFIGPNADRFHGAWEATRAKVATGRGGIAFGFCWPALLFGFAWFFYRRMWAAGLALLVVPVVLGFFFDMRGGGIGVMVATALFSKSLYVQHAVSKIGAVHEQGGGGGEAIAAAGGVSVAGGAIGGLILAIGVGSSFYLIASGASL